MTKSTNLNLPYILPNQAQKHVTHNEAIKMLDALVQLSVVDNALSAPPQNPSEGDSYIIASSPTEDWATHENQVTIWHDGAWSFYSPNKGWITWVESNNTLQAFNGFQWVDISGVLSSGTASKLGINATADTTNRLSVNSAAILFNKEVDDVRVKLNKQAISDNATFLFQTNFSGRAEIGLAGDDDFHFKVSSDGVTWKEGIAIDAGTGEVSFPNTTSVATGAVNLNYLVDRIFARTSPTQWGFCHVASEAYTDTAKTTKAIIANDVVKVIEDLSPNGIDLVAGGTSASTKIKLRLDPVTVGVNEAHLTTHFLKVNVPAGGFVGKLIMAYRSGCVITDVDVPAGDWEIWSGKGAGIASGFIGAFAVENISQFEIEAVVTAFHNSGSGSKPLTNAYGWFYGKDAFYDLPDLRFFDFSNTSNLASMFRSNGGIKRAVIMGNDFSSVTTTSSMFGGCANLTTIDVSNWDMSKVTTMSYMFSGCANLTTIDVSNWDMSKVTTMSYMFSGCASLTTIDVSNWDMSKVTTTSSMFGGCANLTTIDVSNWDVSKVTTMSYMFNWCTNLTTIDVSNWDMSKVTTMSYMFYSCTNLNTIYVGSAFNNTPCKNFSNAFNNCALDQQTVDNILVGINAAGTSNGTLHISGGTNSAPSSTGNTAKTALVGRGWTVTTQ